MTRLAVVGTDTGVGKTVVTAGLVGRLRATGIDARAVKPAQTGHPPDDDAAFVREVCGDAAAATCLRYLEAPLAPAVAAKRKNVDLSYHAIRAAADTALSESEVGILEGIGGLHVPLADGKEVIDLVADLDCPAIVVARPALGTLNHTTLTVEALTCRSVPVEGVVINSYAGKSVAERTNPAVLDEMIDPPVHTFPSLNLDDPSVIVGAAGHELPRFV